MEARSVTVSALIIKGDWINQSARNSSIVYGEQHVAVLPDVDAVVGQQEVLLAVAQLAELTHVVEEVVVQGTSLLRRVQGLGDGEVKEDVVAGNLIADVGRPSVGNEESVNSSLRTPNASAGGEVQHPGGKLISRRESQIKFRL